METLHEDVIALAKDPELERMIVDLWARPQGFEALYEVR